MDDKWTYTAGYSYAGQHFSVWVQAIQKPDGTYSMASKVEEEPNIEKLEELDEKHGFTYFGK